MKSTIVKQEKHEAAPILDYSARTMNFRPNDFPVGILNTSSSSSCSSSSDSDDSITEEAQSELNRKRDLNGLNDDNLSSKKRRKEYLLSRIPRGFLAPKFGNCSMDMMPLAAMPISFVPPKPTADPEIEPVSANGNNDYGNTSNQVAPVVRSCKQFWRAGDYEASDADSSTNFGGMDHLRVHPKFLHSNATSHKWALGAFAELLDNSLDEVCNGATYVHVDMLINPKDNTNMLLVQDNGGGMTPDKMRMCMSLGYSAKSKMANTIGQYGNGFKTSTMRLGADVLVFSRCQGHDGKSSTQSIGMLSYTFLRETGKEDIVVPIVDFEKNGQSWNKMQKSSSDDFNNNLETIGQWSPFLSKEDLFKEFNYLEDQGTRILIYNLWEDDEGNLELDFDSDPHDIQIRGVNRDQKNINMANRYPNSRHFLTYRHSLKSYASILYLKLPPGFRIILRGKDIEHHSIIDDMMMSKEITYRPKISESTTNDLNMVANVTIGFVKDAKAHIDIQGFNVYHKNRLIKPFWRVWNAAGSDGRGAIGVLEANFVEPAHDKQGFERTPVLSRLEARLVAIQKEYWCSNCHEVGYQPRRQIKNLATPKTQSKPSETGKSATVRPNQNVNVPTSSETKSSSDIDERSPIEKAFPCLDDIKITRKPRSKVAPIGNDGKLHDEGLVKPREDEEPMRSSDRYKHAYASTKLDNELYRCRSLEIQLTETEEKLCRAQKRIEEMDEEQIAVLDLLEEERNRRAEEREKSNSELREARQTILALLNKVKFLEARGKQ